MATAFVWQMPLYKLYDCGGVIKIERWLVWYTIPWWQGVYNDTDITKSTPQIPVKPLALQHIKIYAYQVKTLQQFTQLPPAPLEQLESLEQLRALWHGWRIAVYKAANTPHSGVDTLEDLETARAAWVQ